jgi:hypothetical protein
MADNNVSIGISADVTQAKAQLGVLQASLRDVRKEWRQLAQEQAQNKGADPARYLEVTRQLQSLDREIVKHTVVTHASTRANTEHTETFRRMGIELSHLTHAAGLSNEVLRATKFGLAGLVGTQVIRTLGEVSDRIKAITDQAKQTGAGTQNVQALGKAFRETGGSAADATSVIDKIAGAIRDAERAALQAGGTLGGPATLRGGVKDLTSEVTTFGTTAVQVYRGASKEAVDFGDKLKGVRVNITDLYRQFPGSGADRTQAVVKGIATELNNLVAAGKYAEANLRSLDLTGLSLDRALPSLNKFINEREKLLAAMKQQGTLLDPQTEKKALEYAIAVDDVTESYQGLQQQIALMVFPDATRWIHQLQEFLSRPAGQKSAWEEFLAIDEFKKNIAIIEADWQALLASMRWGDEQLKAAHDALWKSLSGQGPGGGGAFGDPSIAAMPLPEDRGKGAQPLAQTSAAQWNQLTKSVTENTKITVGNIEGAFSGLASWSANLAKSMVSIWNAAMSALKKPDTGDWSPKSDDTSGIALRGGGGKSLTDTSAVNPYAGMDPQAAADAKAAVRAASGYVDPAGTRAISSGPTTWREIPTGGGIERPFASGGYIRGPGSGTSDSILARLSNGEFVVNSDSVRRLGVGFLQGLNSFASGGLVGALPRFASGGAVSSPAGFTIVLGGHSFNASTDNATAASLARVARSQSMRSAGRKPGWAN